AITLVEIIGGLMAGSLSLISDALHNFSDGIAIIVSYAALRLSRKPGDNQYTFGLKRAQVLAAILNAGVLLAISAYLVREAALKLLHPANVNGGLMLVVAAIGLVANLIGTWLLHRGAKSNLNIRSAYLHLLSDAVSSVAVIVGAIAIQLFGAFWVDPVLSLLIAVYVGWESWKIIQSAIDVLMLKVPGTISLDELQMTLEELPGVCNVHHIHLWRVDDNDLHFEAHVDTDRETLEETGPLAEAIENLLYERFAINHVTLQFEAGTCVTGKFRKLLHGHG
ncbi:MAG TPA: cation diffusion facilitator family transporter, partial [Desulfuromonadales bacterium]|nr:cation diffusion facilitator family transporter [Desulfuromonadales bacterium]